MQTAQNQLDLIQMLLDQWCSGSIATLSYMQWLFLLLNPGWSGEFEKLTSDADEYFRNQGSVHTI